VRAERESIAKEMDSQRITIQAIVTEWQEKVDVQTREASKMQSQISTLKTEVNSYRVRLKEKEEHLRKLMEDPELTEIERLMIDLNDFLGETESR
jgi:septal ring factor EnvC (AmiA/AmiB activator)